MRLKILIGLALGLVTLSSCESAFVATGMAYTSATKPRDPISTALRDGPYEKPIDLTPKPFVIGASRTDVEQSLARAHYKKLSGEDIMWSSKWLPQPSGADAYALEVQGLPCAYSYHLFVLFDANDRLLQAVGKYGASGCL